MNDSMVKLQHIMTAEDSIVKFIDLLEDSVGEDDKVWLFEKNKEMFDSYYVDTQVTVNLSSDEEKEALSNYFNVVQDVLRRMFTHIILMEFRFHLLTKTKE